MFQGESDSLLLTGSWMLGYSSEVLKYQRVDVAARHPVRGSGFEGSIAVLFRLSVVWLERVPLAIETIHGQSI